MRFDHAILSKRAHKALMHTLRSRGVTLLCDTPLNSILNPCCGSSPNGQGGQLDVLVVGDGDRRLFGVDFGVRPKQFKTRLDVCKASGLPLFQVQSGTTRVGIDRYWFLAYLIDLWICTSLFLKRNPSGTERPAEPFVMSAFAEEGAQPIIQRQFKFALAAMHALNRKLKATGLTLEPLAHLLSSSITLAGNSGDYICYTAFPFRRKRLFGRTSFKIEIHVCPKQQLRAIERELAELCTALSFNDLCFEIESALNGRQASYVIDDVRAELSDMSERGYSVVGGFGDSYPVFYRWFSGDLDGAGQHATNVA